MKVKVDKTVLASVALHVVVLGGVLLSFSTKALVMVPEETVSVDVISSDQFANLSGSKTGKKENQNKIVEKVSEKPVDDAVGKISEKPPVVTETAPPPTPKVEEKPVEKKPEPPKPKAKAEPKQSAEGKAKRNGSGGAGPKAKAEEGSEEGQPKRVKAAKRGSEARKRKQRRTENTSWPVSRSCSTRKTRRVPRRPAPR